MDQAQFGSRAGSSGRLLPAVRSHPAENGEVLCTLAFGRTVPLPAGTRMDEECFVFMPQREP